MWNPAEWNNVGVVGLAAMVAAFHIVAYMRGWFVPGRYHTEIVDALTRRLELADARSQADATTIDKQAQTIAEKNATEVATTAILQSIREIGSKG